MKANVILAFLAFADGTSDQLPSSDPVYKEIEELGLIKSKEVIIDSAGGKANVWHVTPEGTKLIGLMESAGEYYTAQRQAKKDAAEIMEKAKSKWNSVMDSLKF